MITRSFRSPGPIVAVTPRRGFPWARIILVLAILGVAGYLIVPLYLNFSADGVVEGDLVPVAPLFRARIDRSIVECGQQVHAGQALAVVTNFMLEGQYEQNYQKATDDLRTQLITQNEGLTGARIDEATAREKYLSSTFATRRLETLKNAYRQTYEQGAIGRATYDSAVADWEAAKAETDALHDIWAQAQEHTRRIEAENAQRVAGYANQVALIGGLRNQVGSQVLAAPVGGRVVECTAQPQAIVEAGAPIYKIFATDRAYVLAFFSPNTVSHLHVGQIAQVSISGLRARATGKIVDIYPNVAKLPDQLTKYFWQHEQWSQYRPVKILLSQTPADVRLQLTYDTQAHIEIKRHSLPWRTALGR